MSDSQRAVIRSPRELSDDQAQVLAALRRWHEATDRQVVSVGGYAGTGKTTLIGVFRNELERRSKGLRVALASYTGKASRVLDSKIRDAYARFPQDYVGTIHGLIYSRILEQDGKIIGWKRRTEIEYDLIIVDEASMVDEAIWNDLLSFGKRIIAVGDHGQLPPVEGRFNLLERPDLELKHIHRQAEKNPILHLSQVVRETGLVPPDMNVPEIKFIRRDGADASELLRDFFESSKLDRLVLCGTNRTRRGLNKEIRAMRGFEDEDPVPGDRVICLRNNWNAEPFPVCNGMLGSVLRLERDDDVPDAWKAAIQMDDEQAPYEGYAAEAGFRGAGLMDFFRARRVKKRTIDFFDYGYALTVHKAQGSEAPHVAVFLERVWTGDVWKRWLYTAVTRARETLILIG